MIGRWTAGRGNFLTSFKNKVYKIQPSRAFGKRLPGDAHKHPIRPSLVRGAGRFVLCRRTQMSSNFLPKLFAALLVGLLLAGGSVPATWAQNGSQGKVTVTVRDQSG